MSVCAKELTWAGGTHVFDLNSKRVSWMISRAFPGVNGDTPAAAFLRFEQGTWSPDDVKQTMRIALIGGGLSEQDTDVLVAEHVSNQPLAANAMIACQVLGYLFTGATDGD